MRRLLAVVKGGDAVLLHRVAVRRLAAILRPRAAVDIAAGTVSWDGDVLQDDESIVSILSDPDSAPEAEKGQWPENDL